MSHTWRVLFLVLLWSTSPPSAPTASPPTWPERAGRHGESTAPFERLLSLCNDVGLIAEEYDTEWRRSSATFLRR